jgi:hypothetical protein
LRLKRTTPVHILRTYLSCSAATIFDVARTRGPLAAQGSWLQRIAPTINDVARTRGPARAHLLYGYDATPIDAYVDSVVSVPLGYSLKQIPETLTDIRGCEITPLSDSISSSERLLCRVGYTLMSLFSWRERPTQSRPFRPFSTATVSSTSRRGRNPVLFWQGASSDFHIDCSCYVLQIVCGINK